MRRQLIAVLLLFLNMAERQGTNWKTIFGSINRRYWSSPEIDVLFDAIKKIEQLQWVFLHHGWLSWVKNDITKKKVEKSLLKDKWKVTRPAYSICCNESSQKRNEFNNSRQLQPNDLWSGWRRGGYNQYLLERILCVARRTMYNQLIGIPRRAATIFLRQ